LGWWGFQKYEFENNLTSLKTLPNEEYELA